MCTEPQLPTTGKVMTNALIIGTHTCVHIVVGLGLECMCIHRLCGHYNNIHTYHFSFGMVQQFAVDLVLHVGVEGEEIAGVDQDARDGLVASQHNGKAVMRQLSEPPARRPGAFAHRQLHALVRGCQQL